jgi:hypothetical protein
MKRLALATALLATVGISAEAGSLPKPISLVNQVPIYHSTHYVRGAETGKGGGGSTKTVAEARQTPAPKPAAKPAAQPAAQQARAD